MQFLTPVILWALAALSIPVIIHLFRFRTFKPFYFSQVRWLKALDEKQQSSRKLKHILILCSRLLALLFLVLAFAKPAFPGYQQEASADKVIVFIDNTQSMTGGDGQQDAWSSALEGARALIASYPPEVQFRILTHTDDPGAYNWLNENEALRRLQETRRTYGSLSWNDVAEKINYARRGDEYAPVYVFSDFQTDGRSAELVWPENTQLIQTSTHTLPDNISLDTMYFSQPPTRIGQMLELTVEVTNRGADDAKDVFVQLEINGDVRDGKRVDLIAEETRALSLSTVLKAPGWHKGRVRIDDFPMTFDDDLFFSFNIREAIPVVLVRHQPDALDRLFADEVFSTQVFTPGNVSLSAVRDADLVVWNAVDDVPSGVADALINAGTPLFVVMPDDPRSSFFTFMERLGVPSPTERRDLRLSLAKIQWDDPLFYGVFTRREERPRLPELDDVWLFPKEVNESILSFADGTPYLFRQVGRQPVLVLASDVAAFSGEALFLPIFHNAALYARGGLKPYHILGEIGNMRMAVNEDENPLALSIDERTYIPPQRRLGQTSVDVRWDDQPNAPGTFTLSQGDEAIGLLSVNANRQESRNPRMNAEEIQSLFGIAPVEAGRQSKNAVMEMRVQDQRVPLWWWGLLIAGAFLLAELILIRFLP